jgi:hypothetical protein
VYYLNTESDFIGLANTKPGITNFTWNNSNVNVRFFLICPNTYRPRGGSVVVLWGEMLRGVFDTQRNWLPLSIATSWIGTADIPQGLTKSDQKLHARIDKVLRYDGSAVVLPSAIADSVRAADVPTGLRLLDNWDNVQWYNPILTDKEQLSQKGTLLLGASINRNMVAINVDGFWVIGAAANIYDNANKVSDHSLTGDFEKLTPDQQTQIKTILLNLYILTPVGMEKPKERK